MKQLTDAEKASFGWLEKLCEAHMYADRLGPICDYLKSTLDTAQQEPVNAMLVEALEQAHDMVDHWGCYASDYFQQKHDLVGDKAKINAALTAAKQAQPERAQDSVNAKRYLWLRDEAYSAGGKTPFIVIGRDDSNCYVVSGTTADEAIDAAIKQGGQHD